MIKNLGGTFSRFEVEGNTEVLKSFQHIIVPKEGR